MTDHNPPVLSLQSLSVAIAGKPILKSLSLDLQAGQITALTGESGSGKSMTALAVMGLLPQGATATGNIVLNGQSLLDLDEPALCDLRGRQVGMVFQEPMTALNPVQCIGDQVAETLRIHTAVSRDAARHQAADLLARVGLSPDRIPPNRYPHELSGGQRQRVVIAMAIAMKPRVLIADEPTTALDVTTQARILSLLRDLSRQDDMALMMITHDLAVVADMADQIAVMQTGEIVEQAPTAKLFAQIRHPYTKRLFAASAHQADLPPARPANPLLRVKDVYRDYALPRPRVFARRPKLEALKAINFEIATAERVGLVGESGCGKSTLTRAILGLDPIRQGTITLDGLPVYRQGHPNRAVQRQIQVVFQDPYGSFNPRHRVARLLSEPFHLLDDPPVGAARRAILADALTAVGLSPEDQNKYPHAFSGGQRQRLAIARALIIKPRLIVFDEAVSALDVQVRAQILDLMAELSRTYDLAYLFISHDLSVIRSITDRVLVMQAGEIVEDGPTNEVLSAPRHPYTQSLLEAAPQLPRIGDSNAA